MHYPNAIELWGSSNSTCTSQTKVKHIPAVKKPWWRSGHHDPLLQMVRTLTHLDKLKALRHVFKQQGMLVRTVADYMAWQFTGMLPPILSMEAIKISDNGCGDRTDVELVSDPKSETQIWLASQYHMSGIYMKAHANLPLQRQATPPISLHLWPSSDSQTFPWLFEHFSMNKAIQTLVIRDHLMVHLMGQFVFSIQPKYNFMCLVICVEWVECIMRQFMLTLIPVDHLNLTLS